MYKKISLFALGIFSFFLFSACEVGLGEAVDVIAPIMNINYPPDNSTIMNTFTLSGSASDDTYVALISISVQRTSDSATVTSYSCTPNVLTSSWSCNINNKKTDSEGNTSFEIPDGDYTVSVTAMDSVGRSTSKSRVYHIDNTAPVVVLKRPKVGDSFGKSVKITGDVSDKNVLSSLYFTAYTKKSDGTFDKIGTIRQSNISGVGLDLVVAKKYDTTPSSDAEKKLNDFYNALYDTRGSNESAEIYCVVEVADSAKEYRAPGESAVKIPAQGTYEENGFTPSGNLSTCYYIYNEISDKIYSETATGSLKLTNSELVSIFEGSYSDSSKAAEAKTYLKTVAKDSVTLTDGKMSKFSLNPNNSPYFDVSGYRYDGVAFGEISNESKITVTVYPGRDQIELNPDTMRVVAKRCDDTGNIISGEDEIVIIESLDNINAMAEGAEKTAAQTKRAAADITESDTVKISCSIGKLTPNRNYLVIVEGNDLNGNSVDNGSEKYGFEVQSNGKPPVIVIDDISPQDLAVANAAGFTFSGTIQNFADTVTLKYNVIAKNEKDANELQKGDSDERIEIPVDENAENAWSVTIPANKILIPDNSLYLYYVTFYAEDSNGNDSEKLVRIHIDTAKPSVGSVSVSPYYSVSGSGVYTVNGKVSVSAIVSDNYEMKNTTCTVKLLDNQDSEVSSSNSTVDGFSIELKDIDTTAVSEGKLVVTLKPVDTAGNEATENTTIEIVVDQSTDKPVVQFTNVDTSVSTKDGISENTNLFAQTGSNKILGTVTDDDRINSIVFEYAPLGSSTWTTFYRKDFASTENYVSYNLSAPLQKGENNTAALDEGYYKIKYTITDKDGGSESVTTTCAQDIVIAVDNGAPTLEIETIKGELVGTDVDKAVNGTVSDGNGVVAIYRYSTDSSRNDKEAEYGTELAPVTISFDENGKWNDTIHAYYNGDEFAYVAVDSVGRTTKVLFSFKIDSVPPFVAVTSPSTQNTIYIGSPYISSFRGTAEDPKYVKKVGGDPIKLDAYNALSAAEKQNYKSVDASDVSEVYYKIKKSDGTEIATGTATGNVSWSANVEFKDNAGDAYADASTIEFYAKDGAGLDSVAESLNVLIDTATPVVEITGVEDSSGNTLTAKDGTYYIKGGFVISGYVTEKNLQKVECSISGGVLNVDSSNYDEGTNKTPFTYTVTNPSSGRKSYGFTATDKASQTSATESIVIVRDSAAPSVSAITLSGDGSYKSGTNYFVKNGTYTLSGTTSDDFAVNETIVKLKKGDEEKASATLSDSLWSVSLDLSDAAEWENGNIATVEITASDMAGNVSAVQTITITLDTVKPELKTWLNWKDKDMLFLINTGKYKVGTYGKSTMMEVKGCFTEEGSGIKAVYYQIIPTGSTLTAMESSNYETLATGKFEANLTESFTIKAGENDTAVSTSYENAFKVNLSGFKESTSTGTNKLRLLAVDNVGNFAEVVEKALNVDTTAPVFNTVASVEKLTNANADVTISGDDYYVTDSGAGFIDGSENEDPAEGPVTATIDGVALSTVFDAENHTVGEVTQDFSEQVSSSAVYRKVKYSVKINQVYLETLGSGNYVVKVTAKDAANDGDGNESYTNIATIKIDKDAPTVTIANVTPIVEKNDKENVNGTITVTGTAGDANALGSVTLYTSEKASDAGTVNEITYNTATYYQIAQFDGSAGYNWSTTIDTTKYTDNHELTILAVAVDEAGNQEVAAKPVYIDQSTDIPEVSFSNMTPGADAKDNLFGLGSTTIYASASDDDGIAKIEYSIDDGAYTTVYTKGASEAAMTTKSVSIDLSTITTPSVLTSGEHTIKFKITDINTTPVIYEGTSTNSGIVNFAYDVQLPTILVSSLGGNTYSGGMFAVASFTVEGTASDDSGVASVYLLSGNAPTGDNLYNAADEKWTDNVTGETDTASGQTRERTYQVTDKFGRTSTVNVKYQVDIKPPKFLEYASDDNAKHVKAYVTKLIVNGGEKYFVDADGDAGYSISVVDSDYKPVNWFTQTQLTIAGEVEEDHLQSIDLDINRTDAGSQMNKRFAFSGTFANGDNFFTLKATDEAGNEAQLGALHLYVDTIAPTVSVETKKSDGTTAFENGTVLGAGGEIKFIVTAADFPIDAELTSGIKAIYLGTTDGVDESSKIAEITAADLASASNVFTYSVGDTLSDGTHTLYIRAQDVAGNYSTAVNAATFVVDKTAPSVAISSPISGKTVDKKITIKGTVSDANLDSSVLPELWIKEKTSGSWAKASDASVSNETYNAGDWSLKFDTEKYDDEKEYYIAVVFTDKAGNVTKHDTSTHLIKVSQDNDRPVVIFPNVPFTASIGSADANRIWIKSSQITGTVTDSDGVAEVYMLALTAGTTAPTKDSDWGDSIYSTSSGMWTVEFTSEGPMDIYFRVIDAEGGDFISSASAVNDITAPKLKYNNVVLGESANYKTILYSKLDWNNPTVPVAAYVVNTKGVTNFVSNQANFDALVTTLKNGGSITPDGGTWKVVSTLEKLGGPESTLYVFVKANDPNGIESVAVKLAGISTHVTKAFESVSETDKENYYALYSIDLTGYTGYLSKQQLEIIATDKATNSLTVKQEVDIDNQAPTVEIKSPNSNGIYFYGTGSNSIMGAADDDSSVQSIYLGFSKNDTDAPSSYTDILASRDGTSASSLSASSWIINFDDRISTATDYSHMEFFNSFVKTAWEYDEEIPSDVTEKPLYIWTYAKDSLGNSGTPASIRYINIYTQGDIPSIDEVSYPDANGKVGGTVRVTGSASISDTSVAIEDILIQIDLSYETEFNEAWEDELTALINAAGDLKSTLETEYLISEVELGDGTKIRGVKASGTNSWNLPINKYKEFNLKDSEGKDKNRDMAIRVYAVNNSATYKKAGKPVVVPFTLDPGSPVFGNKEPLKLVQYNNNDARTGGVKASRLYTDNMWISGKWWLEGSIEDDSGIKQITVSKNGGTVGNIDASYIADTTEPAGESYKNKTLMMPVGTDEEDKFGTEIYEITAYEGAEDNKSTPITITLNYDNKAPVFDCTTLESGKTNSIVQSDGTYEIKGTLKEDSSASANQSGFERIAFSFTKTSGGKTYVIDPMISQGSAGDANVYETGDAYSDSVKVVQDSTDGLYWRKATDCTTSGKEISLSGSTTPANVRAGGLCKLDGMIYRIESVSGSKVYVNKDLPTFTSSSKVDAYFAIAQVIDNTVKEVGVTTTFNDADNNIDNDDDDKMVDYYLSTNAQWVCSINSKNIKDGSVKVNFVAFDQAGNLTKASYDGRVSNNRPRIAGVSFATDRNGDDVISTNEYVNSYSGLFATNGLNKISGVTVNGQRPNGNKVYKLAIPNNGSDYETLSGDSVMTIKGLSYIVPEIVGGNNGVGYTYAVKNTTDAAFADNSDSDYVELNTNHGGDESVRDTSTTRIVLTAAQLMSKVTADAEKDFRFTIWDSTDGTTPGTDSNSSELLLRMNVALYDGEAPNAKIRPFYWTGKGSENSSVYYSGSTAAGHIELEDDWKKTNAYTANAAATEADKNDEYDADPKVSGTIYIEGQADDNVLVNELYLSFPGLATSASGTFGSGFARFAYREGGIWKSESVDLETQGVEVVSVTEETDKETEKNIVTFKLAINTAKITNQAGTNIAVEVQAKDRGTPTLNAAGTAIASYTAKPSARSTTSTSGEAYSSDNTPYYRMDVVPYITSISTAKRSKSGLKNTNIRSASGKYSIMYAASESAATYHQLFITVEGFNLNPDDDGVRVVSTSAVTSTTTAQASFGEELTSTLTDEKGEKTTAQCGYKKFCIENIIPKSGYLEVFVNGVRTLNNINNNGSYGTAKNSSGVQLTDDNAVNDGNSFDYQSAYNREPDYYTTKNIKLTDDRYLLLWNMHTAQTPSGSNSWKDLKNAYYPVMVMNGDNPVFGYMNGSGGPSADVGRGAGTGAGSYYPSHAMPQRAEFNGSSGAEVYTEYLIKASAWDAMGMAVDEGGRYYNVSCYNRDGAAMSLIYDRYAELYTNGQGWGAGTGYSGYSGNSSNGTGNNAITLDNMNYSTGVLLGRYMYPKLIANGNSTTGTAKVYMAYYDDGTGEIVFRNFQLGKTVSGTATALDSSHTDKNRTTYKQYVNFTENTGNSETYSTGRLTAVAAGSKYYDMAVTSDNHVVIVYYDEDDSKLKLIYSTNAVDGSSPTANVAWTTSSVSFPSYAGTYVSMTVDSSDGIHIAAFDASDADLKYFYLPSYSSTSLTNITVDAAGSVGHWTGIAICTDSSNTELYGKPVISYYNSTETGTRESIKMAYPKAVIGSIETGVDSNGYTTGAWEYMTVPAITPPQGGDSKFQKVCLGFDTKGLPVLGFCTSNLEFGKQLTE